MTNEEDDIEYWVMAYGVCNFPYYIETKEAVEQVRRTRKNRRGRPKRVRKLYVVVHTFHANQTTPFPFFVTPHVAYTRVL